MVDGDDEDLMFGSQFDENEVLKGKAMTYIKTEVNRVANMSKAEVA